MLAFMLMTPDLIQGNVVMFTDDAKIYSVLSFDDNLRLQKDLDNGLISGF